MFVLGTAGHVDHGKSSFLRALTGLEPDRLPEEKKRGLTIELNFVWLDSKLGHRVGIVDVPGHHRFVKNMITGMSIDAFLFLVAADDGWMPQSEEHLQVLKSFNVKSGIGIVTKTDLVSEDRVLGVSKFLEERFKETFGHSIPVFKFSSIEASTLPEIKEGIEKMISSLPKPRDIDRARIWVDRVFVPKGMGIVATGTLREGGLKEGDEIRILPLGKKATVKSIQSYQQSLKEIKPVTRVALGLSGIKAGEIKRGDLLEKTLVTPLTKQFDACVESFHQGKIENIHAVLHMGTTREQALWIPFPKEAHSTRLFGRIKLENALPLRAGERFLLRSFGEEMNLIGGVIVDTRPPLRSHRKTQGLFKNWEDSLLGYVQYTLFKQEVSDIQVMASESIYSVDELQGVLNSSEVVKCAQGSYASKLSVALWIEKTKTAFTSLQKKKELLNESDLLEVLKPLGMREKALEVALKILQTDRMITKQAQGYQLSGFKKKQNVWEEQLVKQIEDLFAKAEGFPLPVRELGSDANKVNSVLRQLVQEKKMVSLGEDHFIPQGSYEKFVEKVVTYIKAKGQAKTSDLREFLNTSRKNAVLILEKMDRDRLTYLKEGIRRLLRSA